MGYDIMRTRMLAGVALALVALVLPAQGLTKRQARKLCRRQVPDCVRELLMPTTTTEIAPNDTTSTSTTTSSTSTTLPPVRARSVHATVTGLAADYGSALLTVTVNTDGTVGFRIDVTEAGVLGKLQVCPGDFIFVEPPTQVDACYAASARCAMADPWGCDSYAQGIAATFTVSDFPAAFDLSAPFEVQWQDQTVQVP
jgi:hypothetical protein